MMIIQRLKSWLWRRREESNVKRLCNEVLGGDEDLGPSRIVAQIVAGSFPPQALHPKVMGGKALTCRPGTTDWTTLLGVFEHGYHMPPVALKSPTCIVDLGLNVGFTASHFAQIYPAARVIGVEMDEKNFKCAVANTAPWKDRLTLFNAAIWSSDGELAYEANCREDSYHVSTAGAGASQTALKKVKSISMQTLLKTCGVNSVDFVKMDVEGAEKELLLTGSLDWLKCVKSIKIEIHEQDQYPLYVKALQSVGFNAAKDTVHWSAVIGWKD